MDPQRGESTGVNIDACHVKGHKWGGANGWGKRWQKWHTARGCRVQEGHGEKVEGDHTASAGTGGGSRWEWTPVQVDRQ